MIKPGRPPDDAKRVEALHALNLLDTPQEERYDRIVRQLSEMLDVPIVYLALLDADRQWLKAMIGGMECETERDLSFCAHTILDDRELIVPDAKKDPRFFDNPMVVGEPFIRFYAGVPLTSNGRQVGTLCIADRKPRQLDAGEFDVIKAFAGLIEQKINSRSKIFISYSHQDEEWKNRLVSHLAVLQQQDLLNIWDDRRIGAGEAWKNEIQEAMESSSVAVLMVSANFLTSKFILDVEVPRLLNRRDREGLQIVPLVIKPCCWDRVGWLETMNMYPRDARPLSGGNDHDIDQQLAEFAAIVHQRLEQAPRVPTRPRSRVAIEPDSGPGLRTAPEGSVAEAATAEETATDGAAAVRLRVIGGSAGSDATVRSETFLFRQPRIAIGRDPSCDLPLADEMRVVSGEHAEIVADGARLLLIDLGSKNFTYLNEQQLEPERPCEIRPGDVIEIGEYKIRIVAIRGKEAPVRVESTVFDPGYLNPFRDDGKLVADALRRIAEAYDREAPTRRDAALQEALGESLADDADHPALEVIGRFLGGEDGRRG